MNKTNLTTPLNDQEINQATDIDTENKEQTQPSRLLLFIFDTIENFEYKYYSIAGCLYSVMLALIITFLISMKEKHFENMPILEMFFVPTLIMFAINFKLITSSNISPYITIPDLNQKIKISSISLILSLVFFVIGLTKCNFRLVLFGYLSVWPLNILSERILQQKPIRTDLILPFIGVFTGSLISSGTLQIITDQQDQFNLEGFGYALLGGVLLSYTGATLKQFKEENLFTITHIISLLCVIFVPLFFPIQGLTTPGFNEWFFFIIIASVMLITYPIFIRSFAVENASLVISQLCWSIPFYFGFRFLFMGMIYTKLAKLPSLIQVIGSGILVGCCLMIIQLQMKQNSQEKTCLRREKTIQIKQVEMQTLVQ